MRKPLLFLLLTLSFLASCEYKRILKSSDYNLKYEAAVKYYDKGLYYKAIPLIEELIPVFRGTERAERLSIMQAWCDYHSQEYILAAHRFSTFVRTFPFSKHAEECLYMNAICHYRLSPKFSLDQYDTYKAMEAMEQFVRSFPQSNKVDTCHYMLDQMRFKLERKSFETARQYYLTGHYRAAVTALENSLRDFPDTKYREDAMIFIVKAHYEWAVQSVETKKYERFANARKSNLKFAAAFPESRYIRESQEIARKIQESLDKLNANVK
jgi:outer membrane protein assembly factor BamD